jgi:AraC-like DNA-binding protein
MKRDARQWLAVAWRYLQFCFENAAVPRVDELAARLHWSREGLTRAFRESTGRSPAAALRIMQLARARRLLAKTEMTTADVARAAAYGSTRAFYRAFVRNHGMTPSEYRKRRRAASRVPDRARPP